MTFVRRTLLFLLLVAALPGGVVVDAQQPPGAGQQQDGFVPIDQLPPQDQLPAAPLLIGAYAFVLLALFGYVYSVATRLTRVQRDVERLESDLKGRGRG